MREDAFFMRTSVGARPQKNYHIKGEKMSAKLNANVAIQVLPSVQGDEEVVRVVDEVIDYIRSTGVEYYVGPCETAMEGDYEELMEIVKQCQYIAIKAGAPSVMSYVKITYKPEGEKLTIERKTAKHHKHDLAKSMKGQTA